MYVLTLAHVADMESASHVRHLQKEACMLRFRGISQSMGLSGNNNLVVSNLYVGLSENRVPLIPMRYHHLPNQIDYLEDIPHFQKNP